MTILEHILGLAALFSAAGLGTANRARDLRRQGRNSSLALPQVWWTDESHRKAYCCRDPTSFSPGPRHCCRMKPLSTTRNRHCRRLFPSFRELVRTSSLTSWNRFWITSGLPTIQELSRLAARIDRQGASTSTSGVRFTPVENFRGADIREAKNVPYSLCRQVLPPSESKCLEKGDERFAILH
jgi:hypothetical protein